MEDGLGEEMAQKCSLRQLPLSKRQIARRLKIWIKMDFPKKRWYRDNRPLRAYTLYARKGLFLSIKNNYRSGVVIMQEADMCLFKTISEKKNVTTKNNRKWEKDNDRKKLSI